MDQVTIHTDGSCSPNPGPGGWAAILECRGQRREIFGAAEKSTNNIMELTAVVESLKALTRPCRVTIYADSSYVADNARMYLPTWKARGWRLKSNLPVKNLALWQELDGLLSTHDVTFERIAGHAGVEPNERADELANTARIGREIGEPVAA